MRHQKQRTNNGKGIGKVEELRDVKDAIDKIMEIGVPVRKELLKTILIDRGSTVRDALIIHELARGRQVRTIARALECDPSTIRNVRRNHEDALEAEKIYVAAKAMSMLPKVLDTQQKVALDPENKNTTNAARLISEVAGFGRGANKIDQMNVAMPGGQITQNTEIIGEKKELNLGKYASLSDDELRAKLADAEAEFTRPKPPVRDVEPEEDDEP